MSDDRLYISRPQRPLEGTRTAYAAGRRKNLFTIAGACLAAGVGLGIGYSAPSFIGKAPPPTPEFDESIPVAMKLEVRPPAPPPPLTAEQAERIATLSDTPVPAPVASAPSPIPAYVPPPLPAARAVPPSPSVVKAERDDVTGRVGQPAVSPEIAALLSTPRRDVAPDLDTSRPSPSVGRVDLGEAGGRVGPPRRRALQGPSFPCLGAVGRTEAMICAEPALAAADRRLAAAFNRAMQQTDNPERLMREQNRWLAARDRLGQNYGAVMDHYDRRLDELWTPE